MEGNLKSIVAKFADYTKLSGKAINSEDYNKIQDTNN